MSEYNNLDALADQLYQEGLEKAKKESEKILKEAHNTVEDKLAQASQEAEEIIATAKKEAEKLKDAVESEIRQKSKQAVQDLKNNIAQLINVQLLNNPIKEILSEKEFVKQLIISTLDAWKDGSDLELSIPESLKEMESDLMAKVQKHLPGLKVIPNVHLDNGFTIENKEKGYVLSFTDADFRALYEPYLTEKVGHMLFSQKP